MNASEPTEPVIDPALLKLALLLYLVAALCALTCLLYTTALTMTIFFFLGLGAFGLGLLAYLKLVWTDLRRHGVL